MRKFDYIAIDETRVEARGNAHIEEAIREAAILALQRQEVVVLTHNGTEYEAHPGVIAQRIKECIRKPKEAK